MQQPTKLTKPLRAELIAHVESGCSYRSACKAAGISYTTLKRWMGEPRGERRTLKWELARARAKLESNCLKSINLAALEPRHWTAAAWLLQHRVRGEYLESSAALRRPPATDRGGFTAAAAAKALDEAEAADDPQGPADGAAPAIAR